MNFLAIVQARMGSTRLPGKVLSEINKKPMLEYLIERLSLIENLKNSILIATSDLSADDPIELFCKEKQISYYRGDEQNVLNRFYEATKNSKADYIIRLTGDNPLVSPWELKHLMKEIVNEKYDYLSNRYSLPLGMGAEIFTVSALSESVKYGKKESHKEHVTTYILENPSKFKIKEYKNPLNENYRLTVDTVEDFQVVSKIIKNFNGKWPLLSTQEITEYLQNNPSIIRINEEVHQKKV
ncbi:cytidylyltransferase domain-containing protein [Rossellomorea sp. KS-H15a]|uniref:cytidylyltransferase domain-containing protein n=1 Tax=Rossellomorea sp. KS-H15a TaxID=2963940 RepID=UPI0020C618B5|nr:glycosyltransferase family protein [Rossellomorea sp. KS-H15a]UTE77497.1 glycosyltransferase family protein [Rossellomorea sp. KS-H15a]